MGYRGFDGGTEYVEPGLQVLGSNGESVDIAGLDC